jgi:hypothetical protein
MRCEDCRDAISGRMDRADVSDGCRSSRTCTSTPLTASAGAERSASRARVLRSPRRPRPAPESGPPQFRHRDRSRSVRESDDGDRPGPKFRNGAAGGQISMFRVPGAERAATLRSAEVGRRASQVRRESWNARRPGLLPASSRHGPRCCARNRRMGTEVLRHWIERTDQRRRCRNNCVAGTWSRSLAFDNRYLPDPGTRGRASSSTSHLASLPGPSRTNARTRGPPQSTTEDRNSTEHRRPGLRDVRAEVGCPRTDDLGWSPEVLVRPGSVPGKRDALPTVARDDAPV